MTHEAPDGAGGTDESPRVEWTEEERRALDALTREEDPGRALEERTVAALRERGLLAEGDAARPDGSTTPSIPARAAGRWSPHAHPAWWATAVAAALAIFFAGMTVGQRGATRDTRELVEALRAVDAAERAALVQRTGSMYVEALAGLGELQTRGETEAVEVSTEVARAVLQAAALELARLHPDDARYARILGVLEADDSPAAGSGTVRQVLWF